MRTHARVCQRMNPCRDRAVDVCIGGDESDVGAENVVQQDISASFIFGSSMRYTALQDSSHPKPHIAAAAAVCRA